MAEFAAIPGGSVTLKDARRGDERTVVLMPFEIATTTVTEAEIAVGRALPISLGLPATDIRWLDAVAWCNSASEAEGLPPAYRIERGNVHWDPTSTGFRLPTEGEWVHAGLGGGSGARPGKLEEIAWSAADALTGPQPVAGKLPNDFGLFDMLGNVWEWCWDRLDPARYGDYRVLKGGGWADPEWSCRMGVRRGNAPNASVEDVGFRPARGAVGGQGWSEAADRQRAAVPYPRPVGWTPLRLDEDKE